MSLPILQGPIKNDFRAALVLLLISLMSSLHVVYGQVEVMSFNIRISHPGDGENHWNHRRSELVDLILHKDPDLIGLQEVMPDQRAYLEAQLGAYTWLGTGREGEMTEGESAPLLFKKDRFEWIEGGTFWLSKTPKQPSLGWDAAFKRTVVYALLRNRETGHELLVLNTHFDHKGKEARRSSAQQILDFINEKKAKHQGLILMGDLNCKDTDPPMQLLTKALRDSFALNSNGPKATFNGFDLESEPKDRIDYILYQKLEVVDFKILDQRKKDGKYLSDHFPVFASFKMK